MTNIILHGFYRSSAAYRVRIALNLKGVEYEQKNYALLKGEHKSEEYLNKNPQGLVPALEVDGEVINQSLAIIEYLDHLFPDNLLTPKDIKEKARVMSLTYSIACDIHPINNLRILQYLKKELGHDQQDVDEWYGHWIKEEFKSLEQRLSEAPTGDFCHGNEPGIVDVMLIPQVYNANRFKVDLSDFPKIREINERCLSLDPFIKAIPENQPDAP